ncbi:hypothetical protein [Nocardia sp. NPDC046763]|uniref:hypothetical protein n=1 Tax=Nocardia sp. NPDC046763 TaxID=3155256 RepID=UPI0033FFAF51
MNALLDRLVFTDAPIDLPVELGQDDGPELKPRSVKMSDDLTRRGKARAVNLGQSFSAYVRSLIERDLARPSTKGRPRNCPGLPLISAARRPNSTTLPPNSAAPPDRRLSRGRSLRGEISASLRCPRS